MVGRFTQIVDRSRHFITHQQISFNQPRNTAHPIDSYKLPTAYILPNTAFPMHGNNIKIN